ncbi:DUF5343 domain-containing protein [Caulobacter sp. Root1455]|uniref:DUF5343 domain-containing protein n=1 Tax=Caulobacter sp. Root1455 TaxID=1736465 RepID=UPI0012E3B5FB|nr:DUF5343 domain-containing protein [Caulobacter sp. Root1455]
MAIPKAYLTSSKNFPLLLDAIKSAQAPDVFNLRFLESLGFTSSNDRLMVGVLQAIGLLNSDRKPTDLYFRFLDQTQSEIVLAEGIRNAYKDLFQINTNAQNLTRNEVINKFKMLSQGQYSDSVLDKMGLTFSELVKLADFKTKPAIPAAAPDDANDDEPADEVAADPPRRASAKSSLGGLHYNIQIILPESRDPKVYDALFRSLRDHLL